MSNTKYFFLSSILNVLFSILSLPLFLTILDPEDLGYFALIQKFATIGITLSISTVGLVLPNGIVGNSLEEQRKYISSLLLTVVVIGCSFSLLFIFLNLFFTNIFKELTFFNANLLVFLTIPLQGILLFIQDLLTVKGKAKVYFVLTMSQSLVNFAVMALLLFVFHESKISLFLSYFVSSFFSILVGFFIIRQDIVFSLSKKAIEDVKKIFLMSNISDFFENAKLFLENYFLARVSSLHTLGMVDHSLKYNRGGKLLQKSLNRSIWPIAIQESKNDFKLDKAKKLYFFGNLVMLLVAISFTFFSKEIIFYIGKGKFEGAAFLASISFMEILCYNLNSTMTSYFYSQGMGNQLSIATTFSMLTSFLINVFLIYYFKEVGIILSGATKIVFSTMFFYLYLKERAAFWVWVDMRILITIVYYILFLVFIGFFPGHEKFLSFLFLIPVCFFLIKDFREVIFQFLFNWRKV